MMLTGLVIALALTAQTAPTGQAQTAPTVTPDVNVAGARPETTTRSRDPNAVVCRDRPTTGSRFNHRRCRTNAQIQAAQAEAHRFITQETGPGPAIEANAGPR